MTDQDRITLELTREQIRQLLFILAEVLDEGGLQPSDVRVIERLDDAIAAQLKAQAREQ